MRTFPIILLTVCASLASAQRVTEFVNPFIGTDAHGHTFPGATAPFGMVQLSPDTRVEGWDACAGYHYSDTTILGFSHTHLSGTGVADYGDILITPIAGQLPSVSPTRGARFRHATESASPGYYRVQLEDGPILAELTATRRVGVHRYTFPVDATPNILINLHHGLGPDRVLESNIMINSDHEVSGFRRSEGWAKDQYLYFVARFSRPFSSTGIYLDDTLRGKMSYAEGKNIKASFQFSNESREPVIVNVGISAVSIEGARKNLGAEVPHWDFDRVRTEAEQSWNRELSKIEIEGGTKEQRTTFYTALYHVMIAPNVFNDVDGRYRGMDGKIHTADGYEMYTVFSLWDTFRAEHPLLTIIDQRRTLDFVKSLLAKEQESHVLPVWELAGNETWCMIGYHSVPVIVDAYAKGIRGFDASKALDAMTRTAGLDHFGLREYRSDGYISGEKEGESVSKTLEYAYDDWCIAEFARQLHRPAEAEQFGRRSQAFRNIFDPVLGFMRPKENGHWVRPFDPASVTFHYTEANPWQYSFFAPHDVNGLIELYGGREKFIGKLDSLFQTSSVLAGRQQSDITGLIGQYAQGNEPSHHVAYLYNYAGAPWKTQQTARLIMDSLYTSKPDGLCGNDDCGQMSAWYVMSALGFYQVCPGKPEYALGSPLFTSATIHLENGKQFTIRADENSKQNMFIQSASLNGSGLGRSYIAHDEILRGGELRLAMGSTPQMAWASTEENSPRSAPVIPIVMPPVFSSAGQTFADSVLVTLSCPTPGATIRYSLKSESESGVDTSSHLYIEGAPILLRQSSQLHAWAMKPGMQTSVVVHARFRQRHPVGALRLGTRYDDQYTGGGDDGLVDGMRGGLNFRLGTWQGYHEVNLDAVVDLGSARTISFVSLGCLQDNNSWIFFPTMVEYSFSNDSTTWSSPIIVTNTVSAKDPEAALQEFRAKVNDIRARFIRVHAANVGRCPSWHKGAGEQAWLFVDEITVETQKE